jgi:tetratricopeptide (TPR) repeat protein
MVQQRTIAMHKLRQAQLAITVTTIVCLTTPWILTGEPQQKSATFSELAEKAKRASSENLLDEAAALYARALAQRPRWKEGWWSLGTLEYDQDHYAKAANAFLKLLALDPRNGTAHAMLGLCQFELQQDDLALQNLVAAEKFGVVKDEQLRKVAVFQMGLLQLRALKFSSAKETLWQLAKDGVRTNGLVAALGQAALMIRPQDAPAEGTDGYRVVNRVGDAEVALATKDFDHARKIYAELNAEFPPYPNLHLAYGRLLLELHENDGAVAQFQEELQRDPENIHSLLEIAAVRYRVDSQNALPYAERAVKLAPQIPFAHYLLGALRLDLGDAAGAIPELEVARRGLPQAAEIHFALGNAYARTGRKLEAAKARGEFARLNRLNSPQFGAPVHGETPSGLKQKELQSIETKRPPR